MIAAIAVDGRVAFIALRRDPRPGPLPIWRPIRAERDPNDESTPMAAARLCVAALQAQIEPLVAQAKALQKVCRPGERIDTAEANTRRLTLAATLARKLVRAWADLRRLLDEPTESDHVALDGPIARRPDEPAATGPRPDDPPRLTVNQLRAGRTLARLGVRDLASGAGISATAISYLERGRTRNTQQATRTALQTTLEECGIEFAPGGWLQHIDDARAERRPPSGCIRCAQASYLLDVTNRSLGRVHVILREPDKPEPRTEIKLDGGTP